MNKLLNTILFFGEGVYFVDVGDTLYKVALKFNTTQTLLAKDNNLTKEIEVGDVLYVKTYKEIYIVQPTDTLKSLAEKFNTTEDRLLDINKISYIYPYQKIITKDER